MGSGQTEGHTHRQRYRLVTVEMVMIQPLSIKLEKKWRGTCYNAMLMNVNNG